MTVLPSLSSTGTISPLVLADGLCANPSALRPPELPSMDLCEKSSFLVVTVPFEQMQPIILKTNSKSFARHLLSASRTNLILIDPQVSNPGISGSSTRIVIQDEQCGRGIKDLDKFTKFDRKN